MTFRLSGLFALPVMAISTSAVAVTISEPMSTAPPPPEPNFLVIAIGLVALIACVQLARLLSRYRGAKGSGWGVLLVCLGGFISGFYAIGEGTFALTYDVDVANLVGFAGAVIGAVFMFFASRGSRRRRSTGGPVDVFISYKRDDRDDVLKIARALESLELKVWYDAELRSGASFDAEIDYHVRSAKCVLVCWSPGAAASEWVRAEASIGRERGVLAAAFLSDCSLPAPFNLIHADDLRQGVSARNPAWISLLRRIGALTKRDNLADYAIAAASGEAALAEWKRLNPSDPLAKPRAR